jgi:hypothetical protein
VLVVVAAGFWSVIVLGIAVALAPIMHPVGVVFVVALGLAVPAAVLWQVSRVPMMHDGGRRALPGPEAPASIPEVQPAVNRSSNGARNSVQVEHEDVVFEPLSDRELEVLTLLASGRSKARSPLSSCSPWAPSRRTPTTSTASWA